MFGCIGWLCIIHSYAVIGNIPILIYPRPSVLTISTVYDLWPALKKYLYRGVCIYIYHCFNISLSYRISLAVV